MVGRILKYLKDRGVLKEAVGNHISARKRAPNRPYAIKKPREYVAREAGDIVQVDTMEVSSLPGVIIKHFTTGDVVSRWAVTEASRRATALAAMRFINTVIKGMPFTVKAIQVDGGSEYLRGSLSKA